MRLQIAFQGVAVSRFWTVIVARVSGGKRWLTSRISIPMRCFCSSRSTVTPSSRSRLSVGWVSRKRMYNASASASYSMRMGSSCELPFRGDGNDDAAHPLVLEHHAQPASMRSSLPGLPAVERSADQLFWIRQCRPHVFLSDLIETHAVAGMPGENHLHWLSIPAMPPSSKGGCAVRVGQSGFKGVQHTTPTVRRQTQPWTVDS